MFFRYWRLKRYCDHDLTVVCAIRMTISSPSFDSYWWCATIYHILSVQYALIFALLYCQPRLLIPYIRSLSSTSQYLIRELCHYFYGNIVDTTMLSLFYSKCTFSIADGRTCINAFIRYWLGLIPHWNWTLRSTEVVFQCKSAKSRWIILS